MLAVIPRERTMERLIQKSGAPEQRLPTLQLGSAPRSFYMLLAVVAALGITPVIIAWVASGLLP